jgi:hypothetical protein
MACACQRSQPLISLACVLLVLLQVLGGALSEPLRMLLRLLMAD